MWWQPQVREYQYNIVASALAKNTLVCLPTGLGKTFIAAVVMMNFYRWYPAGRVVFMAPTKPLVAQQIDACYGIAGVPAADTIEMTGCMPPAARRAAWQDKRLFFCTPQVFANDLTNQLCDPAQVRCVVIDEAHKATGNHAYCVAIRTLASRHNQFRVLALSATPGSDVRSVQEVINNLLISHIELRTEQCRDIQRYSHERNVEKIVVPLGPEVEAAVRRLEAIIDVYVSRLKQNKAGLRQFAVAHEPGLYWDPWGVFRIQLFEIFNYRLNPQAVYASVRVATLSKYALIMQRQEFFQRYGGSIPPDRQSFIHRNFAMAISLYHGYEIVQQHGLRPLYNFLKGVLEGERGSNSTRLELQRQPAFAELWDSLLDKFKPDPNSTLSSTQAAFVGGHPKLSRLLEIVLEHFQSTEDPAERQRTRVIIFSQYRDSVTEIARMLKQHRPLVRCMTFFGQASTGKNSKGLTQKDQLRVMQEFRQGAYNTLVSTCVGEEGLDIGQVDLIICYDAQKSPVRLIQRMGRTGRARQGRIVMLLAAGKEEASYGASLSKRASVNKVILDGFRKLQFYSDTPRMIPTGLQPTVSLRRLDIQQRPAAGGAARKRRAVGSSVADGGGGCSSAKLRPDQVLDYETRLASSAPTFARLLPPRLRCLPSTLAETEDDLRQHRHPQQQMPLDHCRRPSRFASNGPAGGASVTRHHLVALGRLLGCHRAGATNLMFHAVGLRDLEDANLTAVATQTARLLLADDDLDEDFADDDDVPIPIDDDLDCPRMFDDSAEEQLLMPPPAAQPRLPAEMPLLSTQTLFRGAAAAADAEAPAENANDLQTDGAPISPVFRSSAAVRRHRLSSQAAASAASIAAAEPTMSLAEATSSRRPLYSLRPFQPATAAELESLQSAIQCLLSADEPDDVGEIVDQLAEEWRSERSRLLPTLLLKSKPAAADCDSNWQLLDGAENWSVDDLFASAEDQKPPPEDLVVLASQRPPRT
uniref:ATP-dependent DNA helicase n=1 Tax=Macrostomum lignano TaxID=282301 RepID=A0A1I8HRZ3_9PLAT